MRVWELKNGEVIQDREFSGMLEEFCIYCFDGTYPSGFSDECQGFYKRIISGDLGAVESLFNRFNDYFRLLLTLHLWNGFQEDWIESEVWSVVLRLAWQRGKTGCLLLGACMSDQEISEMFGRADKDILMHSGDEEGIYNALPERIEIWRGTTSNATFQEDGLSWTIDRLQAEWFAFHRQNHIGGYPLLCHAVVMKENILAAFGYENEVVVNPVKLSESHGLTINRIYHHKKRKEIVFAEMKRRNDERLNEMIKKMAI